MSERSRLLMRKEDLYSALRLLEADYQDGTLDKGSYHAGRQRYELEAAEVLRRLDGLSEEGPRTRRPSLRLSWMSAAALAVVGAAMVIFLLTATHTRTMGGSLTGDAGGTPTPIPLSTPSPVLVAAQQAALAHPRDYATLLRLGDAYVQAGDVAAADAAYRDAQTVAPHRPEAPTLHAMLLGAGGKDVQALAQLAAVEQAHPRYARAFLLDGLIASRTTTGTTHAIWAWKRFVALNPKGSITAKVRTWIVSAQKASAGSSKGR